MSIGKVVRARRLEMDLSQTELGHRMYIHGGANGKGADASYLSRLENDLIDQPSIGVIHAVAKALEMTVIDLLVAAGWIPKDEMQDVTDAELARVWQKLPAAEREMVLRIAHLYEGALEGRMG